MGVVVHKDDGPGSPLLPEQIFSVHSFQGGLSYTYRATEERTGIIRPTQDNGGATSTLTPHWSTTSTCWTSPDKFMHWNATPYKVLGNEIPVNPKYFCLHYLKGNIYTYRRWISDNCQQGTLIWAYPIHMFCPLHSLVGSHRLVKLKTLSLPQKIKMYIYQKVK